MRFVPGALLPPPLMYPPTWPRLRLRAQRFGVQTRCSVGRFPWTAAKGSAGLHRRVLSVPGAGGTWPSPGRGGGTRWRTSPPSAIGPRCRQRRSGAHRAARLAPVGKGGGRPAPRPTTPPRRPPSLTAAPPGRPLHPAAPPPRCPPPLPRRRPTILGLGGRRPQPRRPLTRAQVSCCSQGTRLSTRLQS